jgi:Ulp1 family protease
MVDVEHKRLLFFDSLQGKNKVVVDALRQWVQDEAKVRKQRDS